MSSQLKESAQRVQDTLSNCKIDHFPAQAVEQAAFDCRQRREQR
ncbi:hypothetical protein [Paenibacillus tianmuensis]|nr:hypothetical protein [Paenibacillus tianmuensis]